MITNKFLKKGLAVLLSLTIVLSMMPAAVFADDGSNSSEPVNGQETVIAPDENQGDTQQDADNSSGEAEDNTGGKEDMTANEQPAADDENQAADDDIATYATTGWLSFYNPALTYENGKYYKVVDYYSTEAKEGMQIAALGPMGYEGTFTYSSSDNSIATVDNDGNVTINRKDKTGTTTITAKGSACKNDFGDWAAAEASYELTVTKAAADFTTDPTTAAQILAANGGSAVWDEDSKTLTIDGINYVAPKVDDNNTETRAVIMPENSTIVLKGKNTIGFAEGETKGTSAIEFTGDEGIGTIKGSGENLAEGSLEIKGDMAAAVNFNGKGYFYGGTIIADVYDTQSAKLGAIYCARELYFEDGATVNVQYYSEARSGRAAVCGKNSVVFRNSTVDISADFENSGYAVLSDGYITVSATTFNASASAAMLGTTAIKAGTWVQLTGSTVDINAGGTDSCTGISASAGNIIIKAMTYLKVKGSKQAFYISDGHEIPITKGTQEPVYVVSYNYDGSDASGVCNTDNLTKYKYFMMSNRQVAWFNFADNSTQTVNYCDNNGVVAARKLAPYAKGYKGTITYKSSNTSLATVDENTGVVTLNNNGKTGTVTITANATADTDLNYKATSDSYQIVIKAGMADFTLNPTRAAQLLAADGGTATWTAATNTLSIKNINYKAADGISVLVRFPEGTIIDVQGSNTIRPADGATKVSCGMQFVADGIINGSGTLDISGDMSMGIQAAAGDLVINNASIINNIHNNVDTNEASSAAIWVGSNFTTNNSDITVNYTSDAECDSVYAVEDITINGGNVNIAGNNARGLVSGRNIRFNDGIIILRSDTGRTIYALDVTFSDTIKTKVVSANFDGSDAVDYGSIPRFNYFKASSEKLTDWLSFSDETKSIGYCDKRLTFAANTAGYDGTITYSSSDEKLATVSNTGQVTVNSDGKFGEVTITAKGTETDSYMSDTASYKLKILGIADFINFSDRAIQLLTANGGRVEFSAMDDSNSSNIIPATLYITDVKFESNATRDAVVLPYKTNLIVLGDNEITSLNPNCEGIFCSYSLDSNPISTLVIDGNGVLTTNSIITRNTLEINGADIFTSRIGATKKLNINKGASITAVNENGKIFSGVAPTLASGLVAMASLNADGSDAEIYAKSKKNSYKYIRISAKEKDWLSFAKAKETVNYCAGEITVAANAPDAYTGTVTYTSSDEKIATVDNNGKVTINDKAKTGTVTITATGTATDLYVKATASYELKITGDVADFSIGMGTRAAQLLQANGGSATYTLGTLSIDGVSYDGSIIFAGPFALPAITISVEGTNTLGSTEKSTQMTYNKGGINIEGNGTLTINSDIKCGSKGGLVIESTGNTVINGGVNIPGTLYVKKGNITLANVTDDNFSAESVYITGGTFTAKGQIKQLASTGAVGVDAGLWAEKSVNADGTNAEVIGSGTSSASELTGYKYFRATDEKIFGWLKFAENKATADYCTNAVTEPVLNLPNNYDGTVTYKSENEAIATVDENTGAVTLNNNGKTGTVVITATASAGTVKYNEETARYVLTVTGTPDFTVNGERAAQLLAANGGTAEWNADENKLTLDGITYESGDNNDVVILPENATVTLNGNNVIKGSKCANIVTFKGNGTVNGTGTLTVTGTSEADNAVFIGGDKLTIDEKATVNTDGVSYGFAGKPGAILHVNTGCAYAKGNSRAISANVELTTADRVKITAAKALDGTLGEYDASQMAKYKQLRAKYVAANEITFEKTQGNVDYCAVSSVTNTATGLGSGKITYEVTEGADIVDVDSNGKVTIDKGRFGKVTITATQAADDDYEAASASYSFTVRGKADFDANQARALKLLNTSGSGGTAKIVSGELVLENIDYAVDYGIAVKFDGNIVAKGTNSITTRGINNKVNDNNEVALYLGGNKTIKGDGTLNLTSENSRALFVWGDSVTFAGGVTVNAQGNMYTIYEQYTGRINIDNANLIVRSKTNDGQGGWVRSSSIQRGLNYDPNKIKAVVGGYGEMNPNQLEPASGASYVHARRYFSATVKKTITAPEAYELSTTEKPLDAAGVTVNSADINAVDTSYDGDLKNATVQYKNAAGDMLDKITAVGTYEVWLSMPTTDEYQPIAAASIGTLTVTKGTVNAAELFNGGDQTKVYDGEVKKYDFPTDIGCYDGTLNVVYTDKDGNTLTSVRSVGKYDVYVSAEATANFEAVESTKVGTLTITGKEVPAGDIFGEFSKTVIYDGKAKTVTADELTKNDEAYNGTVAISYKQGETDVEAPTDAGTYDVYISADAVGNYAAITETKIGTLTIDKKQLDSAADAFTFAGEGNKQTVKYDGEVRKAVIEKKNIVGYEDGVAKITYKQGDDVVETPTAVGTYTVYVSADESKNYKAIPETEMGTLEIVKGDSTLAFAKEHISNVYYCLNKVETNPLVSNSTGKITYAVSKGSEIADVNAETGAVTIDKGRFGYVEITATQEADGNYEAAAASYNFTVIGQADFERNAARALQLLKTNGGENCTAEWDAATKTLTIENLTYETNGPSAIFVASKDNATLVVKGENVIKTAGDVALNLFSTVRGESDGAKLTLEGNDGIRVNDSHKLSIQDVTLIANGNVNGVYAYNDASVEIKNANVTISAGANALIGKNNKAVTLNYDSSMIKAVASANADGSNSAAYENSKSSTYKYVRATVKTAAPDADVFSVSGDTATYDGTAHTANVTIADASRYDGNIKNATVEYQAKDGSKSNAATNAGEYAILLSIPATDNYQPVKELNVGTLTINKATTTADKAFTYEDETVAYTGNPVSATKIGRTDLVGFDYSKMTVTYKQGTTVVTEPTEKGTYDVYVGAAESDNYNAVEPMKLGTLTIAASDVAATNIFNDVNVSAPYDGNEHTATLTLKDTEYTGLAGAKLSYTDSKGETVDAPVNAGRYKVWVEAPESGVYAAIIKTEIGTVTISKAAAVATDIFNEVTINEPYDGDAHEANLAMNNPLYDGNNNWTVSYYKVENGKETLIDGAPVNAGTYNVHVSADATTNFEAMADAVIGTVIITAKEITFNIEGGTNEATYDGNVHRVSVKANVSNYDGDIAVTYKQGETVVTEPTNAGKYTVLAKAAATANFAEVTETELGTLEIYKATAELKDAFAYEDQTFTYDGNAKTANVTSNKLINDFTLAPVITYKKNGETVTEVKDAGVYEVWVGAVETDNYNAIESAKIGTLTITASELSFSIEEGTNKATYDGNSHKATVKATDSKYDGKLTVTYKQGEKVIDEPTNAGTYDIYVSAEETTNFNAVTETKIGELTIDKATVTAENAFNYADTVAAYNGEEQTANVSAKDIPGFDDGAKKMFIKYKKSGEENFLESNPKAIGTYEVWVGADETNNYNAIEAMKLGTLEITSKTADAAKIFKPVDTRVTYTGEPQSAVLEKVEGSDYDGTPLLSYAKTDGTPVESPTNAGTYKVFVTAKATDTYAAIARTEIGTLTIDKATLNVVDIFGGKLNATAEDESGNTYLAVTAGYDGNAHKINMPTDDKYKDLPWNITYTKGEETLTEAINAGAYDIVVSATGMENYEDVENTYLGTLAITQATASDFEVTGELNPTYDGNKHEVTVTATDSKYDGELNVVYKQNDKEVDPINAGTYEIYVSADAAVNYAAIAETKVGELVIAKATVAADKAFSYEDETFGYDGQAKTANVTANALINSFKATPVVTYKKSGEENFLEGNPQEIGTYEVWAGAAESDNYNAIGAAKVGTLTITQATASDFEVTGELNPIYDGFGHKVAVKATDGKYDGKLTVTYKQGEEVVAEPTNAGTYEIWISAEATATYEAINKKLDEKIVIAKATTTAGHAFSYEDEILTFDDATKTAAVTANELINGFKATPVITYKKDGVEVTSPKEIGVYEVWVGAAESDNYNAIEPAKLGTMTIKDPAAKAFDITGTIVSWDEADAEIKLYDTTGEDALDDAAIRTDMRDNNGAKAIVDYSGKIETTVEKAGKYEQTFKISGVEAGTYKLAIFKAKRNGSDPYVVTVMDVTIADDTLSIEENINMWLYGDVNNDGAVNGIDGLNIQRKYVGLPSVINDANEYQCLAADVNGDGAINGIDGLNVQRKYTGLTSIFDRIN